MVGEQAPMKGNTQRKETHGNYWLTLSARFMSDVSSKRPSMTAIKNTTHSPTTTSLSHLSYLFSWHLSRRNYLIHYGIYEIIYFPEISYPSPQKMNCRRKRTLCICFSAISLVPKTTLGTS